MCLDVTRPRAPDYRNFVAFIPHILSISILGSLYLTVFLVTLTEVLFSVGMDISQYAGSFSPFCS